MQPIRLDASHLNAFRTRRPPETPGDPTETPRKLARRPRGDPRRPPETPRRPHADPEGSPAESAAMSVSLTQRAAVGTPGHLARGQQFLGQNYFPVLAYLPVRENKNVTFCCDAFERGSRRRPCSVVTRIHLVAATTEAWPWGERGDDVSDDEDEGKEEGKGDVPCPCPCRPCSSG